MRQLALASLVFTLGSSAALAAPMLERSASVYQSRFCRLEACNLVVKAPLVQDGDRLEQRAYRLRGGVYLVSTRAAPLVGKVKPRVVLGAVRSVTIQGSYAQGSRVQRALPMLAGYATVGRRVAFDFDFQRKCLSGDVVNAYPFQIDGKTYTLQCNRFPLTKQVSVTIYQPNPALEEAGTTWWNQFNLVVSAFCGDGVARADLRCPWR
jgi:hypothetical protein